MLNLKHRTRRVSFRCRLSFRFGGDRRRKNTPSSPPLTDTMCHRNTHLIYLSPLRALCFCVPPPSPSCEDLLMPVKLGREPWVLTGRIYCLDTSGKQMFWYLLRATCIPVMFWSTWVCQSKLSPIWCQCGLTNQRLDWTCHDQGPGPLTSMTPSGSIPSGPPWSLSLELRVKLQD